MKFNEEHIIDYIEGRLEVGQIPLLEKELEINRAFNEQYMAQKLVHEALDFHRDESLKEKFREWQEEIKKKETDLEVATPSRFSTKWLAIAASIILMVASVFIFTNRETKDDKLFATYYVEPTTDITRDVTATSNSQQFTIALQAYAEGAFEKSIIEFSNMKADDPRKMESVLLTLDAMIQLRQWERANEFAKEAIEKNLLTGVSQDRLEWTLALLAMKLNDKASSNLLSSIAENENHIFQSKAIELIRNR